MKTQRREPTPPKKPRLLLVEGTQPYGFDPQAEPPAELAPDEKPTARRGRVVISEPPNSGRYSYVYGRDRR